MTGFNKVFLDTTPLIYFLDNDPRYGEKTKRTPIEFVTCNLLSREGLALVIEGIEFHYYFFDFRIDLFQARVLLLFQFFSKMRFQILHMALDSSLAFRLIRGRRKDNRVVEIFQVGKSRL